MTEDILLKFEALGIDVEAFIMKIKTIITQIDAN